MQTGTLESPIFLIAERFGHSGGGEAIKAYQYACYLIDKGRDVVIFTHDRSVRELGGDLPLQHMRLVVDGPAQKLLWRSRVFRVLLQPYFHLKARQMIVKEAGNDRSPILHYISPVSPVAPRFAPQGFRLVFGPMTGNIYYPDGFRRRMSLKDKLRERLHQVSQKILGRLLPEKKRAQKLLVSGYERTRASLELAGCNPASMADVVDSGVSSKLALQPRVLHTGVNTRFMCSGRMVDHKGMDLAIHAVAKAKPYVTLDVYGDGPENDRLRALVLELNLMDRVKFKGWVPRHDDLIAAFASYRGYIFPSLAEANGIVMQEAMMVGLPVVTLRWGGPSRLADNASAVYIEPTDQEQVTTDIAAAMDRLAWDPDFADALSASARERAERNFEWNAVAESWEQAYSAKSSPDPTATGEALRKSTLISSNRN